MYYNDHAPPHFHAKYGAAEAVIGIDPLQVLAGSLPPRAMALALEWAMLRRAELLDDWQRSRQAQPLVPIEELP